MNNQAFVEISLFKYYFDDSLIIEAKKIFEQYHSHGIILNNSFGDNKWYTSNEYENISFDFKINKKKYKELNETILQLSAETFIEYLKAYIIVAMKDNVLRSLQGTIRDVKKVLKNNFNEIDSFNTVMRFHSSRRCSEFFSSLAESKDLNYDNIIDYIEICEEYYFSKSRNNQRVLSQLRTYFIFNDLIEKYWNSETDINEKLFYYPIYLWWRITAIIPLRPREFLLTKKDCLKFDNDNQAYLTLRRNKIKGGSKEISHKIDEDYVDDTFPIDINLANEIRQYQLLTQQFDNTQLETLFKTEPHYEKWGMVKKQNSRFLTYTNLNTILKYFYKEVIEGRYGIGITEKQEFSTLDEDIIEVLNLGDTRHIAMINIISEGASPIIAMELARHDNIDMSSHYFSNFSTFVECKAYSEFRRLRSGSAPKFALSRLKSELTISEDPYLFEDKSKCYSEKFKNGIYEDCMNNMSSRSKSLLTCDDCPFYSPAKISIEKQKKYKEMNIRIEIESLSNIVKQVNKSDGNADDINSKLMDIAVKSQNYKKFILREKLNGTKKNN